LIASFSGFRIWFLNLANRPIDKTIKTICVCFKLGRFTKEEMNQQKIIISPAGFKADIPKNTVRGRFFLQTLHEAKQEFQNLEDIQKIMEILLLTAMGAIGVSEASTMMIAPESNREWTVHRGIESADEPKVRNHLSDIMKSCFIGHFRDDLPSPIVICRIKKEEILPGCLSDTDILIQWVIENSYTGLAQFGEKILFSEYDNDDIDFLFNLFNIFTFSLHNLQFRSVIENLNALLVKKTEELNLADRHADYSKKELDRRVFHLQSLYDLTQDMADLKDTDHIREAFLMMTSGIFSVEKALIYMVDSNDMKTWLSCRGVVKENIHAINPEEFETLIKASRSVHSKSKNAQIITDKNILKIAVSQFEPAIGLVFIIKKGFVGLIALGEKITRKDYTDDDRELLLTLTNTFMVFMENVRSFETIEKLNSDLEKQNTELNQTIKALTDNRHQIELLEKAKDRIRLFIHKEKEKSGRVSVADIVIILCFGTILGVIYNFSSPTGIGLIPQSLFRSPSPSVSIGLAKLKYDEGNSLFVDARPSEFYNKKHIRNAVNLPLPLFDFVYMMKFATIDPETLIIVYGRNISRRYDEEAAIKLKARGHPNVRVMTDGLEGWRQKGFPVSDEN
jgi:rhodanese-related sulfurtransferase